MWFGVLFFFFFNSIRAKNASPSGGSGQKKRSDSQTMCKKPRRNVVVGEVGGRGSWRGTGDEQKSRLKSTAGNGNRLKMRQYN